MLGFNGGLLGIKRRQESTTPGVWFPNERAIIAGSDPYWENVALLLRMDGSNSSTAFSDSSKNAIAITANGNAQVSTAQSRYGGSSLLLDGTGDFLSTATSSLFAITGDFFVEFDVYINTTSSANYALAHVNAGGSNGLHIYYYENTLRVDNGLNAAYSGSANLLPSSTWRNVAVGKSGSTLYTFVEGTLVDTRTAQSYGTPNRVQIGRFSTGGITNDGNCYIDEFRLTNGVCRFTSSYTVRGRFPGF